MIEKMREDEKEETREKMKKQREDERENEERCKEMKENLFFKNVSRPSNPPDELVQNDSKKSLSDELFLHFSSKVQNLTVFSIIYMIRIRFFRPVESIQNGFRAARSLTRFVGRATVSVFFEGSLTRQCSCCSFVTQWSGIHPLLAEVVVRGRWTEHSRSV